VKQQCRSRAITRRVHVELGLQHGIEKLEISSTSSLKHVSFFIYVRFESGIAPLANSSWIILGFSVDKHTAQGSAGSH